MSHKFLRISETFLVFLNWRSGQVYREIDSLSVYLKFEKKKLRRLSERTTSDFEWFLPFPGHKCAAVPNNFTIKQTLVTLYLGLEMVIVISEILSKLIRIFVCYWDLLSAYYNIKHWVFWSAWMVKSAIAIWKREMNRTDRRESSYRSIDVNIWTRHLGKQGLPLLDYNIIRALIYPFTRVLLFNLYRSTRGWKEGYLGWLLCEYTRLDNQTKKWFDSTEASEYDDGQLGLYDFDVPMTIAEFLRTNDLGIATADIVGLAF